MYLLDIFTASVNLAGLPGIGRSTANAIVSQASDRPAAVLDGNVRRVLARHAAIEGWTGKAAVQKALWTEAVDRLPATRGAEAWMPRSRTSCPGCLGGGLMWRVMGWGLS